MIDENKFFRGVTLRICGNLAIEDAMRACTRYIGEAETVAYPDRTSGTLY